MKNFILLLFVILGSTAYAEKVVLNSYNPEPCESGKKNELLPLVFNLNSQTVKWAYWDEVKPIIWSDEVILWASGSEKCFADVFMFHRKNSMLHAKTIDYGLDFPRSYNRPSILAYICGYDF